MKCTLKYVTLATRNIAAIVLLVSALIPNISSASDFHNSKSYALNVETIASGLHHPWAMAMLPDNSILVTERRGTLWMIKSGKKIGPLKGLPKVSPGGQGGLLDVILDQNFSENRTIYLSYSTQGSGGRGTAIAKATLSNSKFPDLINTKTIFRMNKFSHKSQHFGSRIAQANDGSLYFTIGDRGERPRAQNPFDHAGSVLRINNDGSIPRDNPYTDGKSGLPEIWSTGHRNPQGATIDPATGKIWTVEHGAKGGDEINQPKPGKNYGWPKISYGRHYSGGKIGHGTHKTGFQQPIHYWDPSIAPSGLAFYSGNLFPKWQGDLLVGALKFQKLVRLKLDGEKIIEEEALLSGAYGRIRDVRVFDDGAIWILTDSANGKILRITPDQ